MKYDTKDSGARAQFSTGMVRDTQDGKPRFDLLFPLNVPYSKQMLTRFAELMERGAKKYDERNWEKARTQEELDRYYSSAMRHLVQWMNGEDDEDHAAAVMFNILAGETTKYRMLRHVGNSVMTMIGGMIEANSGEHTNPGQCDATYDGKQCILPALHRDEKHLYTATGALHG